MDFGLARKGEAEEEAEAGASLPTRTDVALTQMGSVLGTPAYMPPEQAVGDLNAIGPRSDVYSLGAVFDECLTGKRPFDGPDTASVIKKILHIPPPRPREIVKANRSRPGKNLFEGDGEVAGGSLSVDGGVCPGDQGRDRSGVGGRRTAADSKTADGSGEEAPAALGHADDFHQRLRLIFARTAQADRPWRSG